MLFCTWDYAKFFALVLALYWAMPWRRARVGLLLCVSLYFYACWNRWLALLIASTSLMDYAIGLGLEANESPRVRKALLAASLVANLGLLAAFKYAGFFLASLESLLASCGVRAPMPLLKLVLPVGISFYTFEAISYTVDVYRRRIRAERDPTHFLLFITFFPHLVAGPIVRARDFLPQVARPKRWDWARAELGVGLFLMGLFKKLAIADRMALYADPVFANPEAYGSYAAWIATVAYAIQIYCDFSGYTDMALGSAHLLGYKLSPNFRMPYLARNVGEFWHRWHISLSTWLRDYLFIPLGGSRKGSWTTARNLLITMTLGGLWHGASWTFIAWGFLHGLLLIIHRAFRGVASSRPSLGRPHGVLGGWGLVRETPAGRAPDRGLADETPATPDPRSGAFDTAALGTIVRVGLTFTTVAILWVFFRSETFAGASAMLRRLFVPTDGLATPLPTDAFWTLLAVVAAAHAVGSRGGWRSLSARLPAPALGFGYAAALTLALLLAPTSGSPFIYFQF